LSRIDELIAEHCPDGVEFFSLGDVAETVAGLSGKTKADFSGGSARFVSYKNAFANLAVDQQAPDFVVVQPGERQNRLLEGDIVITGSSESLDEVGMSSVVTSEPTEPLYLNSFCFALRLNDPGLLLPDFSKHLFRSEAIRKQIRATANGVTRINISKGRFLKVRIPMPPLQVQREIVRVLDQFTQLEAELDAEIMARRLQRLAFARTLPGAANIKDLSSSFAEHIRLGEVASQYVEPMRVQADTTYTSLGVKWYGEGVLAREPRLGSAIKGTTLYGVKPGHFIYNRMFVTEGSFAVVPPELANGVVSNEFPVYELDSSRVLPKWLLLYFQDEYTLKRIAAEVTGVERGSMKSRRRWKEERFEAFQVALPSISVQREMVRVVGTVSAIESALRDELTARRKQHKHYRDRLLTFDEAVA
jgi:type I restriction enzyme S subunit